MSKAFLTLAAFVLALSASVSRAESLEHSEQALKAAELKLACCCKQASSVLASMGRKDMDSLLKESQTTWEKYRDAMAAFEIMGLSRNSLKIR